MTRPLKSAGMLDITSFSPAKSSVGSRVRLPISGGVFRIGSNGLSAHADLPAASAQTTTATTLEKLRADMQASFPVGPHQQAGERNGLRRCPSYRKIQHIKF